MDSKEERSNKQVNFGGMKTTEVNKELIGRRCECIFTGLMVTGVIEDTEENEHTKEVKVRFDRPTGVGGRSVLLPP